MKALSQFLRTTIVGGILFLLPIVVISVVLGKAFDYAQRVLRPIIELLPDWTSSTMLSAALTIVAIGLLCFCAGLIARSLFAQRMVARLESAFLSKAPVYTYVKQVGASMMGASGIKEFPVVLVQISGALATWNSN